MARLWEPSRTGEASLQNLTFAFKIVRYCGLWRTDSDTKTYTLYTFVMTLTFILLYGKLSYFCFSAAVDKTLFVETLSFVFILTPVVVCAFFILVFPSEFTEIVERNRAFVTFVHTGEEDWKYVARRHAIDDKRRLTMYYTAACEISTLCYVLRPVVNHFVFGRELDLPFTQLIFTENKGVLLFCVQYLAQILMSTSWCSVTLSVDVFCFNIIASCSHQLNVLTCMILNVVNIECGKAEFTRENTRVESDFEGLPQSSNYLDIFNYYSDGVSRSFSLCESRRSTALEEQRNNETTLRTLSKWHQELLKTAGEMAKLLNAVMLCHYIFASFIICMFTYNVQNSKNQSQLISAVSSLLLSFSRIFILGWISSELSSESLSVADAAYFCNWYDLSLSAKKTLIIMMARAQSPVVIRAGPTGSLSLETCKKLLEAAYSYLNFLNNTK